MLHCTSVYYYRHVITIGRNDVLAAAMWHPYVRLGRCSNRIWLYYHPKNIYIHADTPSVNQFWRYYLVAVRCISNENSRTRVWSSPFLGQIEDLRTKKFREKKNVSVHVPPRYDYNIILYIVHTAKYNYYYYADCRSRSSAAACRPCSRQSDRGFADSIFTRCHFIHETNTIYRGIPKAEGSTAYYVYYI